MIPIVTGSTKLVTDKVRAIGHLASLIVVGGMLGGTVLAIYFVPVFFVWVRRLVERGQVRSQGNPAADDPPAAQH